jgi:hypothetical protein
MPVLGDRERLPLPLSLVVAVALKSIPAGGGRGRQEQRWDQEELLRSGACKIFHHRTYTC